MPRFAARARASATEPSDEYGDGIPSPVTFSLPRASTASAATSAESIPPERPRTAERKPHLRGVVADAEDERAAQRLERLAVRVVVRGRRGAGPGPRRRARGRPPRARRPTTRKSSAKSAARAPDAATVVEDHRAAVEDELVVSPDEVQVRDRHAAVRA